MLVNCRPHFIVIAVLILRKLAIVSEHYFVKASLSQRCTVMISNRLVIRAWRYTESENVEYIPSHLLMTMSGGV